MSYAVQKREGLEKNRLYSEDQSIHDWYRFVLSFPPHLVRNFIDKFQLNEKSCVLDPFAGTGTTLVECKKIGLDSIGIEANPVVQMAASAKIQWDIDIAAFQKQAQLIFEKSNEMLELLGSKPLTLGEEKEKLIINHSISPIPLHKSLILEKCITQYASREFINLYRTAFAKQIVLKCSNLHFGPEVGVSRKKTLDAPVNELWLEQINKMSLDLELHKENSHVRSNVYLGDSRTTNRYIADKSIDAIITSPPYPNEKDYTRTTRLESVLLGFIKNKIDLRTTKEHLLRSNSRNIYKGDDDQKWIDNNENLISLMNHVENTRLKLGKTSGFEKLYHKIIGLYFGGMARHLENLKPKLKNGAQLAYVVGDQASFFRIPIRTGQLLAEIAEERGFVVKDIELFRTRIATATKELLREEVLILEWKER